LASHALDEAQLSQLTKQVARCHQAAQTFAPLTPFKLGLISNATTDFICPALVATALRHGIALECIAAPFGQVAQQALSSDSEIRRAQPDAVLIAVDFRGFALPPTPGDAVAAEAAVAQALSYLTTLREGIKQDSKTICLVQTLARPVEGYFGSLDLAIPGTLRSMIDAVNRGIAASIAGTEDVLVDVAGVAETVGLAEWHSPIEWNTAKVSLANN
jgi:predicted enzyme involved in methoxymalonyl-ACP biosynthesis